MAASKEMLTMPSVSTTPCSSAQRTARKRFRIDEDLCLLKEVVSADPYGNPAAWEDVLRNVVRAVLRNLTIRAIKERVDLLVGYFRQQDTVNLRKSGTEEQYGERERLLQEVSDLMRNAGYVPRTMPRKGNGMGRRRPTTSMPSGTTRQCMARELRDSATASMAEASDDGKIIWMGHKAFRDTFIFYFEVCKVLSASVHSITFRFPDRD
ncbi:hypothetical protein HPB49_004938 [Dermacentor silvarum]|uniref:Uncharacterized protein n=1 Tax=Dermacentor silvarum TaxID=543639 RepID=A0ACB8DV53_DERSI|nr:hypothetical protein HPB49_004938 [Dermacentor silvarum]